MAITYHKWVYIATGRQRLVEVWFSVLTRAALQGASFTSPEQVRSAIEGLPPTTRRRSPPSTAPAMVDLRLAL